MPKRKVPCSNGCGRQIVSGGSTGLCRPCFDTQSLEQHDQSMAATRAAALERKAAGAATPEDALRDDNLHLRSALKSAQSVIRRYEQREAFEVRLSRDVAEFLDKNPYRPQIDRPQRRPHTADDHEMLIVVSDAHFPEFVDPDASFGLKYDAEICRRRIAYIRDKVIRYKELRETSYPVRKLTICVLGDMLSGNIHEELEVTNQMPMSAALVEMAYLLHDFASSLAGEFEAVEIVFMPGNHPRITKKPRSKAKWDNWEYVMGRFVGALSRDDYTVTVPRAIVYRHKIFNQTIGFSHGDGVKAQSFAGIPHYAMKTRRDAVQALLRELGLEQIDLLVYGHFHQLIYDEGQGCSLLINGSIKGGDEFGITTRYSAPRAVQALVTFHARHGVTDLSRINLGHIQ